MDIDEVIGDELHFAAVSECAEIVMRSGEPLEDRRAGVERFVIAATQHYQILGQSLRAGAAERTIQQNFAGPSERLMLNLKRLGPFLQKWIGLAFLKGFDCLRLMPEIWLEKWKCLIQAGILTSKFGMIIH